MCVLCLLNYKEEPIYFKGVVKGNIIPPILGDNGFGYDPIFYVPEYGCTTAELSPEQKNEVSHRGKALRLMKEIIKTKSC